MLNLREKIRPYISFKVGDGAQIFFWFDNWHPSSPLIDTYGVSGLCLLGVPLYAKLSSVIDSSSWSWPAGDSDIARDIITNVPATDFDGEDTALWKPSKFFTLKTAWDIFRVHSPKVPWATLVWYKGFTLGIVCHISLHTHIYLKKDVTRQSG